MTRPRLPLPHLLSGSFVAVGLWGCTTPATQPTAAGWHNSRPAVSVRHALVPGTVVRLRPVQVVSARAGGTKDSAKGTTKGLARFVHAGLRESLRQSQQLDLAADVEDDPSAGHSILVHLHPTAGRITTTLVQTDAAPIALATTTFSPAEPATALLTALDDLALDTRRALGEHVRVEPVRAALAYSASVRCVTLTEDAIAELAKGQLHAGMASLRRARREDGGCAFTLMLLATAANALGDGQAALRIADEALRLSHRLTPTTTHRLVRTYRWTTGDNRKLLEAGQVFQRERPHDPHGIYTEALALNMMNQSTQALPKLRTLGARWPENASVQFQLGYALLATDQPEAALEAFELAQRRLPEPVVVRPRVMALFHAGKQKELARVLQGLATSPRVKDGPALHEVLRMQAAHAILTRDLDAAARFLLADLMWVRQHATSFDRYALEVAEAGELLARLGKHKELLLAIQGFQQLERLPPTFRAALTYLGGLVSVAQNQKPEAAQAVLAKDGRETWSQMLSAAHHRSRGELREEAQALERAMGGTSDPLVLASYARVLLAAGEREQSERIARELHKRLVSFDQRRPREHPLMSPAWALAYVATARD
ncbi:MAG: tetratricopeptide repeat protein [Planctomycetota bacterium]|jgi:tetratricopeptide (TPR) repeat protein